MDLPTRTAVIIGSGFGGQVAAITLRKRGITDFVILERRDFPGGTWCQNSYLGATELLHTPVAVHLVHPGGVATNIARREETQAFAGKSLTTPPEEIARVVVDAIGGRRTRIVVGSGSRRIWLASRLLPLPRLVRLLWREMAPVLHAAHSPAVPADGSRR